MAKDDTEFKKEDIPYLQLVVYIMCGGGMVGSFAATQPADFYMSQGVRTPYGKKNIGYAVWVLARAAKQCGLDPHHLPKIPDVPLLWNML